MWAGFRPDYVLPGPSVVLPRLVHDLFASDLPARDSDNHAASDHRLWPRTADRLPYRACHRALELLRSAIASLITGLQTMPSIAWFPLAILIFGLNETAIMFVIILGAAPSIANGLISGVDQIPRILLRAGPGSRRARLGSLPTRHLPRRTAQLRRRPQAGLGVCVAEPDGGRAARDHRRAPSIGVKLQFAREFSDAPGLLATMIVILVHRHRRRPGHLRHDRPRDQAALGAAGGLGVRVTSVARSGVGLASLTPVNGGARLSDIVRLRVVVSSSTASGRSPSTTSCRLVDSSTRRRLARTATHRSRS